MRNMKWSHAKKYVCRQRKHLARFRIVGGTNDIPCFYKQSDVTTHNHYDFLTKTRMPENNCSSSRKTETTHVIITSISTCFLHKVPVPVFRSKGKTTAIRMLYTTTDCTERTIRNGNRGAISAILAHNIYTSIFKSHFLAITIGVSEDVAVDSTPVHTPDPTRR